ncbi:hypothetical protein AAHE18_06G264100 [Arachis hypogaea]
MLFIGCSDLKFWIRRYNLEKKLCNNNTVLCSLSWSSNIVRVIVSCGVGDFYLEFECPRSFLFSLLFSFHVFSMNMTIPVPLQCCLPADTFVYDIHMVTSNSV